MGHWLFLKKKHKNELNFLQLFQKAFPMDSWKKKFLFGRRESRRTKFSQTYAHKHAKEALNKQRLLCVPRISFLSWVSLPAGSQNSKIKKGLLAVNQARNDAKAIPHGRGPHMMHGLTTVRRRIWRTYLNRGPSGCVVVDCIYTKSCDHEG